MGKSNLTSKISCKLLANGKILFLSCCIKMLVLHRNLSFFMKQWSNNFKKGSFYSTYVLMLKCDIRLAEVNQCAVSYLYVIVLIQVFQVLYLSKLIRPQESLQFLCIITVDFFRFLLFQRLFGVGLCRLYCTRLLNAVMRS